VAQEWTGKQKLDAVAPLYALYNCPLFHELEHLCNMTQDAFPQLQQGGMCSIEVCTHYPVPCFLP
jgi:hypothetical protein